MATSVFIIGLCALLSIRLAERLLGETVATVSLLGGAGLVVAAFVLGMANCEREVPVLAAATLAWGGITYARYAGKRGRPPLPIAVVDHCRSRLVQGGSTRSPNLHRSNWRTHLDASFSCEPGHSIMQEHAWAFGKAYYGLYFTYGEVTADPVVSIYCRPGEDRCRANESTAGEMGGVDSCTRVHIHNSATTWSNYVTIKVSMGAALNASGGPTLVVGAGGAGAFLSFPDNSWEIPYAMGTYEWECQREESREREHGTVDSTAVSR